MIKVHENEILIYYNPDIEGHRRTVAHALSVSANIISLPYDKTPRTSSIWRVIFKKLDVHPKDLLNKAETYYQEVLKGRDFDMDGWINVFTHNPQLIRVPIAIKGETFIICESPTDIYKILQIK